MNDYKIDQMCLTIIEKKFQYLGLPSRKLAIQSARLKMNLTTCPSLLESVLTVSQIYLVQDRT